MCSACERVSFIFPLSTIKRSGKAMSGTPRFATIQAQYPNNFLFYIERSINKSSNSGLV